MSEKDYCQLSKVMIDNLGTVLESELTSQEFEDALQYITDTTTSTLPAPSTVNLIIFQFLMRNRKSAKLNECSVFLQNLLAAIPSKESGFVYDYKLAISDQKGIFPDLWSILCHLIKSSFSHYGIQQLNSNNKHELVKYPVCDFLIHFYIEFILKFLSLEKDLLVSPTRRRDLIQWINRFYRFNCEQVEIVKDLHNLLDEAVKSQVMLNTTCSATVALNQAPLFDAVLEIFSICRDVLTNYEKFVQFLGNCKLVYLSASICHHILYEITKRKRLPTHKLTLKELVRCFFYISLPSQKKRKKAPVFCIKKQNTWLNKKRCTEKVKKVHLEGLLLGNTKLHEACRQNLVGDLLQMLYSRKLDLNKRNYAKQTALHIACISSSYTCVKFLLDPAIGDRHKPIDIAAVDKQNCTPLHYAVLADDKDIVKLLLQYGGEDLLHKKDCFDFKPHDYAASQDMNDVLKNFFPNVQLEDEHSSDNDVEEFEISKLGCDKNLSLYLYALHSLLCFYFDMFKLYSLRDKAISIEEHEKLACSHFSSSNVNVVCIEDYAMFQSLSNCTDELIKRIESYAQKTEIDVTKELIPIKIFHQTLMK